jgi:protein-arginine kinase
MQASSGYHRFWPKGRGIYCSKDKKILVWVNEGDHLRIISMQNRGSVKNVFAQFSKAVNIIEILLKKETGKDSVFLTDPILGSITCCPTNLGTGIRASVHLLIPKLIKSIGFGEIDAIAKTMNCQARGSYGEHSDVIDRVDISNLRRLGMSERELVEDMIKCANALAKMEDEVVV